LAAVRFVLEVPHEGGWIEEADGSDSQAPGEIGADIRVYHFSRVAS
jgi:hypothetical protein